MGPLTFIIFPLILSFPSSIAKNIEKAFFQNDSKILYAQLSEQSPINISLPEPISFSDQLSPQQTYFFFRQIFSRYSTFEFYPESELPLLMGQDYFIFQARWSFKNRKNNKQDVFQIYFYLSAESSGQSPAAGRGSVGSPIIQKFWKIKEVRAEKL